MAKRAPASIVEHFSALKDPRIERHKQHKLLDIIVIAIYYLGHIYKNPLIVEMTSGALFFEPHKITRR